MNPLRFTGLLCFRRAAACALLCTPFWLAAAESNPSEPVKAVRLALQDRNYKLVQALVPSALGQPGLDPLDQAFLQQSLLTALLKTEQYGSTALLAEQLLAESPRNLPMMDLRTKAYYLAGDSKKSLNAAQLQWAVLNEELQKPGEGFLRIFSESAKAMGDAASQGIALSHWVRLYGTSDAWSEWVQFKLKRGAFRFVGELHQYRLMVASRAFQEASEYLDAAEVFARKGFYREALQALDLCQQAGKFTEPSLVSRYTDQGRQIELQLEYERSLGDTAQPPMMGLTGTQGPLGDDWVAQGLKKIQEGQPALGLEWMEKGLAMGELKSPSLTLLTFAEGLWFAGYRFEAREEFERLQADPQLTEVAAMWIALVQ